VTEEAKTEKSGLAVHWRAIIWLVVLFCLGGLSVFIVDEMSTPVTNTMAVSQLENSDAAFMQLRAYERTRNLIYMGFVLAGVVWTIVLWQKPVRDLISVGKDEAGW
jgi:hypothetical protein